jgi:hypothetical protein
MADPLKPSGVIQFDAHGMPVVDESKLAQVIARHEKQVVNVRSQHSIEVRIDLLRRWGVAVQDARLVCTPSELRPTTAIQYADAFLLGKGVVDDATSNDGDQRQAAPRKKTIAVFAGPLGVGKTVAAAHVLANANPQRIVGTWSSQEHPIFVHAESVFAGAKLIGEHDKTMRRKLERAQVLVIDDLGLEKDPRRTFQPYMDWLINTRYGGDGWTVLTTNLTVEDFRKRYGERIYDRLRHRACWYEIAHESLRGRDG